MLGGGKFSVRRAIRTEFPLLPRGASAMAPSLPGRKESALFAVTSRIPASRESFGRILKDVSPEKQKNLKKLLQFRERCDIIATV